MDKDAVLKTLNASWSWNWQGDHPSLGIGPFLEYHKHDIGDILRESLVHEVEALKAATNCLISPSTRMFGSKNTPGTCQVCPCGVACCA